jgi:hypothetical protein
VNGINQAHFFQSKYLSACLPVRRMQTGHAKAACELLLSFLCVQFGSECL